MTVLHLVDGYPPSHGFARRWSRELSHALADRGHAVQVLSLAPPTVHIGGPAFMAWGPVDFDEAIRVWRCATSAPLLALRRLAWRSHTSARSTELQRLLWKGRLTCDLFHLHGIEPPHALWAWASCRVARRPLVITPHVENGRVLSGATARWMLRRADAVIVLDVEEAVLLRRAGIRPRLLVQVGTPVTESAAFDDGRPGARRSRPARFSEEDTLLVFAGACDRRSGVLTFVDAVRLLRLEGRQVVAAVMGDYGPDEYTRRLLKTTLVPMLNLPVVHPVDRFRLLAAAAVVVLPTDWHSGDAFDAWVADTPALAPQEEGHFLNEDILPRFPAGDPLMLAQHIATILRGAGGRSLVGACRARLAEAPSWTEVGIRVEGVYRKLLADRRSGVPFRKTAA